MTRGGLSEQQFRSRARVCELLLKYPNVALLVPNDEARNEIIELYGKDRYEKAQNSLIYTIAEIKGMEYRYVVCCNVLSAYDAMWREIMDEKTSKKTRNSKKINDRRIFCGG